MKGDLFEELLQSVREGGAILRGEMAPARVFSVSDPDVAEVRELYGLSQSKFASLLGISVRTLQNWEQRRRKPEGAARVLLRVAARHPEAALDVVQEESKGKKLTTLGLGIPKSKASPATRSRRPASGAKASPRGGRSHTPAKKTRRSGS